VEKGLTTMQALLVDHVAIVVKDIAASLPFYRDTLGLSFEGIESNEPYKVDIAFLRCGETLVELLQPTGEGAFKNILDTKGEGFQHVAFRVNNVSEGLAVMKEKGVPLVDESPKPGGGGATIAFLDAAAANNVSIELIER
jgi:methylmalonyl-CoA epimerase